MIKFGLYHGDGQPFSADRFEKELSEGVMKAATEHVEQVVRTVHKNGYSDVRHAAGKFIGE
jgi:hypothetical protein